MAATGWERAAVLTSTLRKRQPDERRRAWRLGRSSGLDAWRGSRHHRRGGERLGREIQDIRKLRLRRRRIQRIAMEDAAEAMAMAAMRRGRLSVGTRGFLGRADGAEGGALPRIHCGSDSSAGKRNLQQQQAGDDCRHDACERPVLICNWTHCRLSVPNMHARFRNDARQASARRAITRRNDARQGVLIASRLITRKTGYLELVEHCSKNIERGPR